MRSRFAVLSAVVLLLGLALLSSQAPAFKPVTGIVDSITEGTSNAGGSPRGQADDDGGDPDGVGLDVPGRPGDPGFTGGTPADTERESGDEALGYYAWLLGLVVGLTW